jgi:hydrogenase/urease accessory protein HupE
MVYQYVRYGIGHILTGYDHLLFVCALVLTAVTLLDLIKVISAFTLAHTITLVLSVLNIMRLPSHIVEPMIAGSIVFVALTNVFSPKRSRGNLRIATAFFFGLFHGLGFAGGLLDAMDGLSGLTVGVAIGAFSLGVEIGHQLVVLPVFFGLKWARTMLASDHRRDAFSMAMMRGGSLVISVAGMIYFIAALRG